MSELNKAISGDWYEIRNALDDPDKLIEYLEISADEFVKAADTLRLSLDEGVVEYKRELLRKTMQPLQSLKWDSKAISNLETEIRSSAISILTPAVQRLFASGSLRLYSLSKNDSDEKTSVQKGAKEQKEKAEKQADIKSVVAEVKQLLQDHPELRTHQEFKKITVQLKYYNTELEKMRSLSPNIPPEKAAGFKKNFQNIFQEIAEKIENAYSALLDEVMEKHRPEPNRPLLKRYDFSSIDKILREQIKNAARIYSTIRFADQERYQMREILVDLSEGETHFKSFFSKELEQYKHLAPFNEGQLKISRAFGEQLSRYYERYAEWLQR